MQTATKQRRETDHAVVLFDGVCNLCNAGVNFIIDRDPAAYFRFAALQSEAGSALRASCGIPAAAALESLVLIEAGRCYRRSTAALRIARRLSGGWPLLYACMLVPRPLRDRVYDHIAANRYRWFGRRDHCRVPTAAWQARFL